MLPNKLYIQNVLQNFEEPHFGPAAPRAGSAVKFGRGPQVPSKKIAISIRLSPQVVAYFRQRGPRWQSRIDELLRYYVAVGGRRWRLHQLMKAQDRVEKVRLEPGRRSRRIGRRDPTARR